MRKIKFDLAQIIIIAFLISVIGTLIIPDNIEPRNIFAQILVDGFIPFTLFIIGFIILFIYGLGSFFHKRYLKGFLITAASGLMLLFLSFWAALFYREIGIFKEDRIIYSSKKDNSKKLVFQYYETGVTGNPNWRSILIHGLEGGFRRFEVLDINLNKMGGDQYIVGDGHLNEELLPQSFPLGDDEFVLEAAIPFDKEL